MQLAFYAGLIANNGKSHQPHVVKGYLNDNKKFVPMSFPEVNTGVSQKTFDIVKQGMYLVVNGAGTATNIKSQELQIAGKTGTAQNPHGKDHSLFICFAPFDHPKIAVAVLVENAGFGATYAAPIAQKVVAAYLKVKAATPTGVVAETGAD
jgi:penicillin-binding protein 2